MFVKAIQLPLNCLRGLCTLSRSGFQRNFDNITKSPVKKIALRNISFSQNNGVPRGVYRTSGKTPEGSVSLKERNSQQLYELQSDFGADALSSSVVPAQYREQEADNASDTQLVLATDFPVDLSQYPSEDLYQSLKHMDIEQILHLVERSYKTMDRICLALCMKNIYRRLLEYEEEEEVLKVCDAIKNNVSFQVLVASLVKKSQLFDNQMVFDMVTFLHAFQFTSTDLPMRVFLHLSRFHINDLHLDQLVTLADWVKDMPATRETHLLLEGIRALLPLRKDKVGTLDPPEAVRLLEIFHKDVGEEFLEKVVRELSRGERWFEVRDAMRMFEVLQRSEAEVQASLKHRLLSKCLETVAMGVDKIAVGELLDFVLGVEIVNVDCDKEMCVDLLVKTSAKLVCDRRNQLERKLLLLKCHWEACVLDAGFLFNVVELVQNRLDDLVHHTESLLCIARYILESSTGPELVERLHLESFTKCVINGITESYSEASEVGTVTASDGPHLIRELWRLKTGTIPDLVLSSLIKIEKRLNGETEVMSTAVPLTDSDTAVADSDAAATDSDTPVTELDTYSEVTNSDSETQCSNLPTLTDNEMLYRQFRKILKQVAVKLNLEVVTSDFTIKPGRGIILDDELHSVDVSGGRSRTAVVCVENHGYFHNTAELKRTCQQHVTAVQQAGSQVLMVKLNSLQEFDDLEIEWFLVDRIKNIRRYQEDLELADKWLYHEL